MIKWATDAVANIVHTSVQDALSGIDRVDAATIQKAIDYERTHAKRVALIAGLERELRRRTTRAKRMAAR